MKEHTLSAKAGYEELWPALFGALSKLAKQGLAASPFDSLDLIHDFFTEAWPDVPSRYQVRMGAFRDYACSGFIHFVRPRIVRMQRLQKCVASPDELSSLYGGRDEMEEVSVSAIDQKTLIRACRRLTRFERDVLNGYVCKELPSERLLARKFAMSRYKLREALIEALGRLVSLLPADFTKQQEWVVARLLWLDRRTASEVAAILNIPQQQVRNAETRNVMCMARALAGHCKKRRGLRSAKNRFLTPFGMTNGVGQRRVGDIRLKRIDFRGLLRHGSKLCPFKATYEAASTNIQPKHPMIAAARLVKDALLSPGKNEILVPVRTHAREVLAALDAPDSPGIAETEIARIDPVWIAEVYQAISDGLDNTWQAVEECPHTGTSLVALGETDVSAVGSAFKETLIADLPQALANFDHWFGAVADENELEDTLNTPEVRSGAPESYNLAVYGITPMTILGMTQAVSRFLDKLMRAGLVEGTSVTVRGLQFFAISESGAEVDCTRGVIDEVIRFVDCSCQTSIPLLQWLLQVASYKPYIFSGFRFELKATQYRLVRTTKAIENLYQRWGVGWIPERELA